MTETTRTFTPDWVSPPGDTIADILEERDWTQVQLAERLGYSTKHISQLINGKAPINEETALKLERVLGSTAAFWLKREAQYRAGLARIEEENRLKEWTFWLNLLIVFMSSILLMLIVQLFIVTFAAIKAYTGEHYRYPLTIRLMR
ncbi:MAG: HigA family addiction module antitoxin [Nostoc sp.]|uniref:HigA family addiction module antitoxin n=1 Tax=Nostoc sp. TaxID=1180 RepID=UPI002FFB474F